MSDSVNIDLTSLRVVFGRILYGRPDVERFIINNYSILGDTDIMWRNIHVYLSRLYFIDDKIEDPYSIVTTPIYDKLLSSAIEFVSILTHVIYRQLDPLVLDISYVDSVETSDRYTVTFRVCKRIRI